MLRPRELKTFDSIALVKPRFSDGISRLKKIFRKKKEFGGEGVDREKPSVPDLHAFWNREVFLYT
jgi:hypothetical protein